jgi:hypothetical protein
MLLDTDSKVIKKKGVNSFNHYTNPLKLISTNILWYVKSYNSIYEFSTLFEFMLSSVSRVRGVAAKTPLFNI